MGGRESIRWCTQLLYNVTVLLFPASTYFVANVQVLSTKCETFDEWISLTEATFISDDYTVTITRYVAMYTVISPRQVWSVVMSSILSECCQGTGARSAKLRRDAPAKLPPNVIRRPMGHAGILPPALQPPPLTLTATCQHFLIDERLIAAKIFEWITTQFHNIALKDTDG
ncbi:hypothetical protein J6590_008055 [Homalodisca vitripennis]|nr:hypothetical protein J6590_008055 [Homalodisca vitripennis]